MSVPPAPVAALERTASQASATPEQLERLRDVLARPEFESGEGSAQLAELLSRAMAAIQAFLRSLFPGPLPSVGGASDLLDALGIALALAVSAAALVAFVRIARGSLAAEAVLATAARGRQPTSDEELALARRYAEAGDLRRAVHHHYVAVLRRLDEQGALRFETSMTNREHLGLAAARPGLTDTLEPLVATFDRLWYGQASCSPAEYRAFSVLADQAWQGA